MSTECRLKVSSSYPVSQVLAEIAWLERKMDEVREQMKRRPSKHRHLSDLQRQKDQRVKILERPAQ